MRQMSSMTPSPMEGDLTPFRRHHRVERFAGGWGGPFPEHSVAILSQAQVTQSMNCINEVCLRDIIVRVNGELLAAAADLPDWFLNGASNKDARQAATYTQGKHIQDYGNATGSALLLTMLQPSKYGITGVKSIGDAFREDRTYHIKELVHISSAKQRSGKGINNKRTNIIEGLLNHFADPQLELTHLGEILQRAWELMSRGILLADTHSERSLEEQINKALAITYRFHDDAATILP